MIALDESLVSGKAMLVDTNFYKQKPFDFLQYLYGFKDLSEVDSDEIIDQINEVREALFFLREFNPGTIPEVGLEMLPYVESLNSHLDFQKKIQNPIPYRLLAKVNRKSTENRPVRKINKHIESMKRLKAEKNVSEQYRLIQTLVKDHLELTDGLKKRDITASFSPEQRNSYETNWRYFRALGGIETTHVDYSDRYIKFIGKKSGMVECTDEKLVAAAFALALEKDSCILSNDIDIGRIINYSRNGDVLKSQIEFVEPRFNVEFLSNLNEKKFIKFTSYYL